MSTNNLADVAIIKPLESFAPGLPSFPMELPLVLPDPHDLNGDTNMHAKELKVFLA